MTKRVAAAPPELEKKTAPREPESHRTTTREVRLRKGVQTLYRSLAPDRRTRRGERGKGRDASAFCQSPSVSDAASVRASRLAPAQCYRGKKGARYRRSSKKLKTKHRSSSSPFAQQSNDSGGRKSTHERRKGEKSVAPPESATRWKAKNVSKPTTPS